MRQSTAAPKLDFINEIVQRRTGDLFIVEWPERKSSITPWQRQWKSRQAESRIRWYDWFVFPAPWRAAGWQPSKAKASALSKKSSHPSSFFPSGLGPSGAPN